MKCDRLESMEQMKLSVKSLLQRTNLTIVFSGVLKEIENTYPTIGAIIHYKPILEGYEDANFKLFTNKGTFVLKIFSKERSAGNIESYIKILEESSSRDIPVAKLVLGKNGLLEQIQTRDLVTYYFITEFFNGDNFQPITPTISDMVTIVKYLAELNTLHFPVDETYDSWGNNNLLKEYQKNRHKLREEQNVLVKPTVSRLSKIDYTRFSKGVIHADMQRRHILKNEAGKYCILDFGCARFDAKVFELSVYLAWFCLGSDTWYMRDRIIKKVTTEYLKTHQLSSYELQALPVLTEAAYASYFLKTSVLTIEGDTRQETTEWLKASKDLLTRFRSWHWEVI